MKSLLQQTIIFSCKYTNYFVGIYPFANNLLDASLITQKKNGNTIAGSIIEKDIKRYFETISFPAKILKYREVE